MKKPKRHLTAETKIVSGPDRQTLEGIVQREIGDGWERSGEPHSLIVEGRGSWWQMLAKYKRRAKRPLAVSSIN